MQIFFHALQIRHRVTYDQISAVSINENKHAHQLQTGLMRYMIPKNNGKEMRLIAPVTWGYFFLSALCASFTWIRCQPSVLIKKIYPLEPRVLWDAISLHLHPNENAKKVALLLAHASLRVSFINEAKNIFQQAGLIIS